MFKELESYENDYSPPKYEYYSRGSETV
jgi:hypothetical protein